MQCQDFWKILKGEELAFFSGVPDSTFKDWMSFLSVNNGKDGLQNIIAVNECEAAAICAGYHLATGKIGVLYCQNSGFGKTINPLTSLLDPDIYSIPLLLLIGWRGEPGIKDEPQHKKMGRILLPLLQTLEIPHEFLPDNLPDAKKAIAYAKDYMAKNSAPYALIARSGIFEKYGADEQSLNGFEMSREEAIKIIVDNLDGDEIVISTTGKTSRELFEYREAKGQGHAHDFLTVGSMGCAAGIAFGAAVSRPDKQFIIFDGDGAALMQLGTMATIGHYAPKKLVHFIFDNNSYESTGGQPSISETVKFEEIARACGYEGSLVARDMPELGAILKKMPAGPFLIVVKVNSSSRSGLGRPTASPLENKNSLMKELNI